MNEYLPGTMFYHFREVRIAGEAFFEIAVGQYLRRFLDWIVKIGL